jgi:predicted nucleic acid-binding protein
MEVVYLTSDILIHYFLLAEDTEAQGQHEPANAVIDTIYEGQLTTYISDVVLFETVKGFEDVPFEEPEEEPDPEDSLTPRKVRLTWASKKACNVISLRALITQLIILGIDKSKWIERLLPICKQWS